MSAIVNKIEEKSRDKLEKIFAKGDTHDVGTQVREVWITDKRQQLDQFREDQQKNKESVFKWKCEFCFQLVESVVTSGVWLPLGWVC